jgi:hypothetical protein
MTAKTKKIELKKDVIFEIIDIDDLNLEYICTKEDKYNNEISYFKAIDVESKKKLEKLLDNENFRYPFWKSEKSLMIKTKSKYIEDFIKLNPNGIIKADIVLKYYDMDEFKGYYISKFNFKNE